MYEIRNLIVIGASAGGIRAVSKVLAGFSKNTDAAIIIVVHVSKSSNAQNIADILQRNTSVECLVAANLLEIEQGKAYIAQPDHHLMVDGPVMMLNQGPHENRYRPSIDVLFRSAAVHYTNQVIGIILTGMLDDGTSGMHAIKSCGGLCIIQDPLEAEFSDMPQSVLNKVEVDYMANLKDIPFIVEDLMSKPLPSKVDVPEELKLEAEITERLMSNIDDLKKIGDRSDFVCPDCGGGLWEVKNDPSHRYRCYTGHVYSEKILQELQDQKIEESLWVSIRMLEEKQNMLRLASGRKNLNGNPALSSSFNRRIEDTEQHISRLKSLLKSI
ncbi:chemotaxis protein CheB [Flavobacterium sp.]|uniref:chemotaxis protein CheB n=1 Tax=Flavobacterium sp. TaxID=239 RepID=UPI00374DE0B7